MNYLKKLKFKLTTMVKDKMSSTKLRITSEKNMNMIQFVMLIVLKNHGRIITLLSQVED